MHFPSLGRRFPVIALALLWAPAPSAQMGLPLFVPPSAEPDVRLQNIEDRPPVLEPAPPAAPIIVESGAPEGAESIRFQLNHLEIAGATVYPDASLQAMVEGLYGSSVSLAEIYDLAAQIQRRYREDGYFLTRVIVPPQHIAEGRMYVEVIEGHVDSVEIQGDIGPALGLVQSYLDHVVAEKPLRLVTLERNLLLAKDIPGIDLKGILQPSADAVGGSRLIVTATRNKVEGMAFVDNIGSTFTGEWEIAGRVSTNSYTGFGENLSITALLSDPAKGAGYDTKNQKVLMGQGSMRLGDEGTYLDALVSYGDSNPGGIIQEFDYDSTKLLVTAGLVHPLIRSRSRNLFIEGGFDYIDSDTAIFEDIPFVSDRLRVIRLAAAFDFRDRWRGSSYARVGLRQGLEYFGATTNDSDEKSRVDASGSFTSIRLTMSRLQSITERWALYTLVAGQYALDPVLADEEFDIGGINFGRGYNPKELSGDDGVGLTTEIQYTRPSNFRFVDRFQLFGFYDFGSVRQKESDFLPKLTASLASAGGGICGWFSRDLSLELQVARPLTRPSARADDTKEEQVLLRAIARF